MSTPNPLVLEDVAIGMGRLPRLVPRHMARDILHGAIHAAQFIADLDHAVPNQPRIEVQCALHFILCLYRRVKLHDEVVSLSMRGLVFCDRPREIEYSPVLDAADDAFIFQDGLACGTCDSK